MYLLIHKNRFPGNVRHSLSQEFFETHSNLLTNLYWTYGGITHYQDFRQGLIQVGSNYNHFKHHLDFKRYTLGYVKKDAMKCIDSLIELLNNINW